MGKYNNSKVAVNILWENKVFFGIVVLGEVVCALTLLLMTSIESFYRLKFTTGFNIFSFFLYSLDNFTDFTGNINFIYFQITSLC